MKTSWPTKRMEKLVELIDLKHRSGDFIRELDEK